MKHLFFIAKHVSDKFRIEPKNVGVFVVGEDAQYDTMFAGMPIFGTSMDKLWITRWKNAFDNKDFCKSAVLKNLDTEYFLGLQIVMELSSDAHWLSIGGWDVQNQPTTLHETTIRLYNRFVA